MSRMIKETDSDIKLFIINNTRKDENGCWVWLLHVNEWGYGRMRFKNKMIFVHRASYRVFNNLDNIDNIEVIMHTCDNTRCVYPGHLVSGTHKSNSDDKISKKRDRGLTRVNRDATHCKNGHEFTPENTYTRKREGGGRICKTCIYNRTAKRRAIKREAK